jgi:hypothetical protein
MRGRPAVYGGLLGVMMTVTRRLRDASFHKRLGLVYLRAHTVQEYVLYLVVHARVRTLSTVSTWYSTGTQSTRALEDVYVHVYVLRYTCVGTQVHVYVLTLT